MPRTAPDLTNRAPTNGGLAARTRIGFPVPTVPEPPRSKMPEYLPIAVPDDPRLAQNIIHFARALRRAGLPVALAASPIIPSVGQVA